jgi:hypothetical protein
MHFKNEFVFDSAALSHGQSSLSPLAVGLGVCPVLCGGRDPAARERQPVADRREEALKIISTQKYFSQYVIKILCIFLLVSYILIKVK